MRSAGGGNTCDDTHYGFEVEFGLVDDRGVWRPESHSNLRYDPVWSDRGTADSNTFPSYPDKDIR